jgi:serine protease inhibitor
MVSAKSSRSLACLLAGLPALAFLSPVSRGDEPQEAIVLRFDRPFLFALRHNRSGSILFLGQVVNPRQ